MPQIVVFTVRKEKQLLHPSASDTEEQEEPWNFRQPADVCAVDEPLRPLIVTIH